MRSARGSILMRRRCITQSGRARWTRSRPWSKQAPTSPRRTRPSTRRHWVGPSMPGVCPSAGSPGSNTPRSLPIFAGREPQHERASEGLGFWRWGTGRRLTTRHAHRAGRRGNADDLSPRRTRTPARGEPSLRSDVRSRDVRPSVKALLETDLRHDPDALVQGAEYSLEAGFKLPYWTKRAYTRG